MNRKWNAFIMFFILALSNKILLFIIRDNFVKSWSIKNIFIFIFWGITSNVTHHTCHIRFYTCTWWIPMKILTIKDNKNPLKNFSIEQRTNKRTKRFSSVFPKISIVIGYNTMWKKKWFQYRVMVRYILTIFRQS